jgi:HK97 family phage major capsid protein
VDEIPSSATVADTNPTFGMLRVPVHTVMARTDISRNMLEDSAFDILEIMAQLFSEAMAIDEDNKFISGRGSGEPRGILGAGTTATPAPETGVGEQNSGSASALVADGLFNLYYALHSQYRGNAMWVGARNTHRDIRKLKDGNSRYLWEDSLKLGEPPTLLGAPVAEAESLPAVAANAYPLIFGDMLGYLIVDRVGMEIRRVEDSTTVGQNKVALYARRRLGGQVIEPWRFQAQKVSA